MMDVARTRTTIPIHRGPVQRDVARVQTRTESRDEPRDAVVSSRNEDHQEQYTLNNMQRSMEDELEKKRQEWEQEVKAMQHDFFNLQTNDRNSPDGQRLSPEVAAMVPGSDVIKCSRTPPLMEMSDGTRMFAQKFDLHGFDAGDISIRVDGRKLHVEGQKESDEGPGRKSTKRFSRQVDVPASVDIERLSSYFSRDGTLSIEAPIEERPPPSITAHRYESLPPPPDYNSISQDDYPEHQYVSREIYPSSDRHRGNSRQYHQESVLQPSHHQHIESYRTVSPSRNVYIKTSPARSMFKTITPSNMLGNMSSSPGTHVTYSSSPSAYSPNSMFSRFTSPSIVTVNETKKLKLNVDVGHDFDPEDITVKLDRDATHIKVHAAREQLVAGRTTKREFSREFELPERVESSTLRASLDAHGRLFIGGSLRSNEDHMQALSSVMHDLPQNATPVRVEI